MKKLLIFLLAFGGTFIANAQLNKVTLTDVRTLGVVKNSLEVDTALILPHRDTTFTATTSGQIVIRPQDSVAYISTGAITGMKWQRVGSSGTGGSGAQWGINLTGDISAQSDLQTEFGTKQNLLPVGTTFQYWDATGVLRTFPTVYPQLNATSPNGTIVIAGTYPNLTFQSGITNNNQLTNGSGYLTANQPITIGGDGSAGPSGTTLNLVLGNTTTADTCTLCSIRYDSKGRIILTSTGSSANLITSVFTRTGAVTAQTGDYTAAQVTNAVSTTGSYTNPSWLVSIPWTKITSPPTTIAGYGITDSIVNSFNGRKGTVHLLSADVTGALTFTPPPNSRTLTINGTAFDLTADRSWTIATGGVGDTTALMRKANNLLDVASISATRTNLGLGTAATKDSTYFLRSSLNLFDVASASIARTNLGLGNIATQTIATFLQVTNNLSDLGSASTARVNLGFAGKTPGLLAYWGSANSLHTVSIVNDTTNNRFIFNRNINLGTTPASGNYVLDSFLVRNIDGSVKQVSIRNIPVVHGGGQNSIYASPAGDSLYDKGWVNSPDAYVRTNATDSTLYFVLRKNAVTAGTYTNPSVTVDSTGRVTVISSGSVTTYTFTTSLVNSSGTVTLVNDADPTPYSFYMKGASAKGWYNISTLPTQLHIVNAGGAGAGHDSVATSNLANDSLILTRQWMNNLGGVLITNTGSTVDLNKYNFLLDTTWVGLTTYVANHTPSFPNTIKKYLNGYGGFVALNTDSVTEGTTNKFYTDARARLAITFTTTGSGAASYNNWTGALNVPTPPTAVTQIKAGPSPYLKVVGIDSVQFRMDSAANTLGFIPTPVVNSWQYAYDVFWSTTLSNGYTNVGLTLALSGNKVQLTGTGNTYTTQYVKAQNSYYEHWLREDTIVINNTISSTTFGIGNGVNTLSNIGWVDLSTGGNAGKVFITTNGIVQATSSGAITFSNGDTIIIKTQRARDILTCTVTDKTSSTSANVSHIVATAFQVGSTDIIHKIGQFGLFVKGGTYILQGSRTTIQEQQMPPLVLFGNSKWQGYDVTNWDDRVSDRLNAAGIRTINMGSSGDAYAQAILRIGDVIQMHPQQVILEMYSNDLRQGTSVATTIGFYEAMKGILESAGIKVWVITFPETGSFAGVMAQFDSAMKQMHPLEYIPAFASVAAGGSPMFAADGVHWTSLGNDTITRVILRSLKISNSLYTPAFQSTSLPFTTEPAKTYNNIFAIGGNSSFTGATGGMVIGSKSTAAFTIQTNTKQVVFNWTSALPTIQFLNASGSENARLFIDSLGNVGFGGAIWSNAVPTGTNSAVVGKGIQQFAAAGVGQNAILGAFGNGGLVGQTTSGLIGLGFQNAYWEGRNNRFYASYGNTKTLMYGVGDSGRLVINPPFYSTLIAVNTMTADNFQVNGSSYINGAVKFKGANIPDGLSAATKDSILGFSHTTAGGDTTGQLTKWAIGPGLQVGSNGILGLTTALPSGTTATSQSAKDSSSKVANTKYVDQAVAAVSVGGSGTSGAYVPTITGTNHISTITPDSAFYIQFGGIVTVDGSCTVTASSTGGGATFDISLPPGYSSHLGGTSVSGQGSNNTGLSYGIIINGHVATSLAQASYAPSTTSSDVIKFHFTYKVY